MRKVAESTNGDQTRDPHQINDVRYQLIERRGNGGADSIRMEGTQGALMGSTYSTCPPDDRHWELRAARIDIDTDSGFGTARNATIRVGKVPVLYVPWFKFPIDDRRVTGLDRKSTRLNSSHYCASRMPSSAGKKKKRSK